MNPTVLSLPCSFMISLLIAKLGLLAMNLPVNTTWLGCAVVLCTLLLCMRSLVELGLIAVLATLAEMHSLSLDGQPVSPDVMLAVLVAIIARPLFMNMMGLSTPRLGRLSRSH